MKNYDEDFDYEYAEDYNFDYIVDGIEEGYDDYDYSEPYDCVLIDQPNKGCTCNPVLNTTQEQT